MTLTPQETAELLELLAHRTRSPWEIRRERLIAAETRLGMWVRGTGELLSQIIADGRNPSPDRRFTRDELILCNFGMLPEDVPARRREHGERQS